MNWRVLAIAGLVSLFCGCMSPAPKSGVLAPTCGKTAVQLGDVAPFGFTPQPGKITVLRIFASWCPYCKTDLAHMSEMFRSKTWTPETVQVLLLAYHNHDEDQNTFAAFQDKGIKEFAFPPGTVQLAYVNQSYADLEKTKSATGQVLFSGWQGVPFGLVFGKDGRLAFRGHFTMSDGYSDTHYKFITNLMQETCTM